MHKAKAVDFHLNACFFQHFTNNSLFGCFTEFHSAADGVEILSVIANHQKLTIFHDDCTNTNIQNSIVTGYAHIFVHRFFTVSQFYYFKVTALSEEITQDTSLHFAKL